MKFSDALWFTLGLLFYSGPFVPLCIPLLFKRASSARFRRNRLLFLWLVGLQALLFVPFLVGAAIAKPEEEPDYNYWLFLPFVWGELTFAASTLYAVIEVVRLAWYPRSIQTPDHALQRTEAGDGVDSKFQS